eukprot:IDg18717t1
MTIDTKPIPVEPANSMNYVKRYHSPLRHSYNIIRAEFPNTLQYAVKALNVSAGPDGLVPTLLVFGALPRIGFPTGKLALVTYERATAVHKASEKLSRLFAKRQLRDLFRSPNGPNVTDVHKALLGSHVLVYRISRCAWERPYALLGVDDETC